MVKVVPTACVDWSLNTDDESEKLFWWNSTYNISIWSRTLKIDPPYESLTDTDVWRAFIEFQIDSVYKLCPICCHPEGNEAMKVCCYCGVTVHAGCSREASPAQIAWKPANSGFEAHLRVCFLCEDVPVPERRPPQREPCNCHTAARRALTIAGEYPLEIRHAVRSIAARAVSPASAAEDAALLSSLQRVITSFFQSPASCEFLMRLPRPAKGGGDGIVATAPIPAFTILGLYPGYPDGLSGEQAKLGRPVAKYALMELNCADYFNVVFEELQGTFTPFINEPSETEESNCGWIQETKHVEGRLSVMTTRDIEKGEELLIGYGPVYPRSYPYRYDAFTFHKVEIEFDADCFALWRWPTVEEKDAKLICYVGYDKINDLYYLWDNAETT